MTKVLERNRNNIDDIQLSQLTEILNT